MKKIMLAGVLLMGLTVTACAQKTSEKKISGQSSKSIRQNSFSENEARATINKNVAFPPAPADKKLWDPRKIYTWPDGQRATPSGHQAMGINDEQTSLKKDRAWQLYLKQHPQKRKMDSVRLRLNERL